MTADLGWEALFDLDGNVTVRALQPLPAAAKWDSPSTSWEAAASIPTQSIAESEKYVLAMVARLGVATDEQIEDAARAEGARWTGQRLRSARAKWVERERVIEVDKAGKTRTGRSAKRWALKEAS